MKQVPRQPRYKAAKGVSSRRGGDDRLGDRGHSGGSGDSGKASWRRCHLRRKLHDRLRGESTHGATASMGVRGQRRQFAVIWGWGAQHGGSQTGERPGAQAASSATDRMCRAGGWRGHEPRLVSRSRRLDKWRRRARRAVNGVCPSVAGRGRARRRLPRGGGEAWGSTLLEHSWA